MTEAEIRADEREKIIKGLVALDEDQFRVVTHHYFDGNHKGEFVESALRSALAVGATSNKPSCCLFCGSGDLVNQIAHTRGDEGDVLYRMGCCDCGADGPTATSRALAAEAWNWRGRRT